MRIAVVTGASSGLGREYVLRIARTEKGIDEIWAVARRADRLEALAAECPVPVRPVPLDLTKDDAPDALASAIREAGAQVGILINAAGFAKIGDTREIGRGMTDRMIRLNVQAAVDVTLACLPFMKKGDRILEICSTAGFQPFQYLNVYAASKAFLYRFSRALRTELLKDGIRVTAVCPYWIKDTEFIAGAEKREGTAPAVSGEREGSAPAERGTAFTDPAAQGKATEIRHYPLSSKAASVAAVSLWMSRMNLPVSTPGIMCSIHRVVAKIVPHELMMGMWALLRRI